MVPILTLLTVVALSLLVVRMATVALVMTGLSRPLAQFQARSAFTNCGFATSESEQVVNHPVRRRIISTLMLLGSAGFVTTIATIVAGLTTTSDPAGPPLGLRIVYLLGGLIVLALIGTSKWIDRRISRLTVWLLRRYTRLDAQDYATLMHLGGEYGINEVYVQDDDWLADKPLSELSLPKEGVLVLGIQRRDGAFVGSPGGHSVARGGDVLLVYGPVERLRELDDRRDNSGGRLAHMAAVADQRHRRSQEAPPAGGPGSPSGDGSPPSGRPPV